MTLSQNLTTFGYQSPFGWVELTNLNVLELQSIENLTDAVTLVGQSSSSNIPNFQESTLWAQGPNGSTNGTLTYGSYPVALRSTLTSANALPVFNSLNVLTTATSSSPASLNQPLTVNGAVGCAGVTDSVGYSGPSVTTTGAVTCASVSSTGNITGNTVTSSGTLSAGGVNCSSINSTGNITGTTISGSTLSSAGSVSGASITSSGPLSATNINCSSVNSTGGISGTTVSCSSVNSTGAINCSSLSSTGAITGTTLNGTQLNVNGGSASYTLNAIQLSGATSSGFVQMVLSNTQSGNPGTGFTFGAPLSTGSVTWSFNNGVANDFWLWKNSGAYSGNVWYINDVGLMSIAGGVSTPQTQLTSSSSNPGNASTLWYNSSNPTRPQFGSSALALYSDIPASINLKDIVNLTGTCSTNSGYTGTVTPNNMVFSATMVGNMVTFSWSGIVTTFSSTPPANASLVYTTLLSGNPSFYSTSTTVPANFPIVASQVISGGVTVPISGYFSVNKTDGTVQFIIGGPTPASGNYLTVCAGSIVWQT